MLRRLLVLAVFCAAALAQKKSDEKSEPAGIDFTVTDPDGEYVTGLTAADVAISQEGKPVKIARLVPVSSPNARTVVVVVDDLGLSLEGLQQVKGALRKFVAEQVLPGDQIAIIRTGVHNGQAQNFTSDQAQLVSAINGLHYHHARDAGANPVNGFLSGTLLQLRFTMEAMRSTSARRAVVLLSERFTTPPGASSENLASVERSCARIADLASQARAVFYAVSVRPAQSAAPATPPLETGLAALVADTGGFWSDNVPDLSVALSRVVKDQSQYYLAEFEPVAFTFDYTFGSERSRRFPKIAVTSSRSRVQVRARNAVYRMPEDFAPAVFQLPKDDLDDQMAASSPLDGGAIAVRATPLFYHSPTEGLYIDVMMRVDARRLTFVRGLNGEYRSALGVSSMAFDSSGQTAGEVERAVAYSLSEEGYKAVMAEGFLISQRIVLRRPGAFQIRSAVKDDASGKIGSAGEYLEIPDLGKGELGVSGLVLRESPPAGTQAAAEIRERATLRSFQRGSKVSYTYQIYNLSTDSSRKSRVGLLIRLFRAGTQVFASSGSTIALEPSPQKAHSIAGTVGLNPEMAPGRYVLHVTATDQVSEKPRSVAQWIDLEVLP